MDREWLAAQKAAGRTDGDIAVEVGIATWMVGYHRRKWGIPACGRSERMKAALKKKYPDGRRGPLAANWKGGRVYTGRKGPKHSRWKGGRWPTGSGYMRIWMPDHPSASKLGYVYEHRVVMEQKIGRSLLPGELVDHIDRDRTNNHPDNLRLQPSRSAHVKDHYSARDQLAEKDRRIAELEAKLKAYETEGE